MLVGGVARERVRAAGNPSEEGGGGGGVGIGGGEDDGTPGNAAESEP